jgi:hypothetical protein
LKTSRSCARASSPGQSTPPTAATSTLARTARGTRCDARHSP